jgi:sialate O-acetylesterase
MKYRFLSLCFLLGIGLSVNAKIILPGLFSNNMVLQQSTVVNVWGKANANANVSIKCSWNGKTIVTKSNKSGGWKAQIQTPVASYTPQSLTISDGNALTINNILIGEVWMCSGQSNMEIALNGFWNCPIAHSNELIAEAGTHKGIRCLRVEKEGAMTPQDYCKGSWKVSDSKNAGDFSATAYHFALELNKVLDVPVGILVCSWGGSTIEGWLPERILKGYSDVDLKQMESKTITEWMKPEIMYNGMLHPIIGYTIKGFLWYQGESNVGKASTYADRLATMAQCWRESWGQNDIPFYSVEIAPYQYGEDSISGALLREAQFKASQMIPNSGMVCTNDLVEPYEQYNIHPKEKEQIGKRLCYMALTGTYKMEGIESSSPSYKSMEIKDGKAILSLNNAENGFNRLDGMEGFDIAGADRVFHPAKAKMVNNRQIEVYSTEVSKPVAIRYCFKNYQPGNVKNTRGLPLIPFRTDNWN